MTAVDEHFVVRPSAAIGLAFAAIVALGCADAAAPDQGAGQQLLILSGTNGSSSGDIFRPTDIFRVSTSGALRENLTQMPSVYGSISLSPDGERLTFYSTRSGCPAVWRVDLDGSGLQLLTPYEMRCNRFPRWSPDGEHISVQTTREGRYSIYVMNPDGSDPRNVSAPTDADAKWVINAGWTPDGRVVFMQASDGTLYSTFTVNPDGTDPRPMFARAGDHSPRWSPDGSRVAFIRETESDATLHVMNADGSDERQLTDHEGYAVLMHDLTENDHEFWSPDGAWIAFTHVVNGVGNALHVIRADGTGLTRLTDYGLDGARFNGWSPDGRITFDRKSPSGWLDVYLIEPDGSGLVNLTNSSTHDSNALWLIPRTEM